MAVCWKKKNFNLLTPSPGLGRGLRACCCIWWFPLIWYVLWTCSEKGEFLIFWPQQRAREGSAGKIFAAMLLHLMIPFNLICNMTMFWPSCILTFWPHPLSPTRGWATGLGSRITFDMFHIYCTSVCIRNFSNIDDVLSYCEFKYFTFDPT